MQNLHIPLVMVQLQGRRGRKRHQADQGRHELSRPATFGPTGSAPQANRLQQWKRAIRQAIRQKMILSATCINGLYQKGLTLLSCRTAAKLANALKMDFFPELRPQEANAGIPA